MADLGEAFDTLKFVKKPFQNIDYFFTQRSLTEEQEYFDKNMNRKTKKVKVIHNFLAINVPTVNQQSNKLSEKPIDFNIEIYGDEGYHYKGTITSYQGIIPNFMIPIRGDKKLFININYIFNDTSKKFINFIDVPKRYQETDEIKEKEDDGT